MRWPVLIAFALGCTSFQAVYPDGGALDFGGSGFDVVADDPDGGAWHAVWGSAPDDVHVVGEGGRVYAWDGQTAVRPNLGSGNDLYGIWGAGRDDIWIAGTQRVSQGGVLFHKTTDTWVQFGTTKFGLRGVWGSGDHRYAVGLSGAVYDGTTAAPFASGMQIQPNPNVPTNPTSPLLYSIGGNSLMSLMVAGDVDTTYFFDTRWHALADPVDRTRAFRAIWAPAGDAEIRIFEGANYFGLWMFTGLGQPVIQLNEEQDRPEDFDRNMWSIWGDTQHVVTVGDEGRIMTYDVGTQEVKVRASPTNRSLYGVWGSSFDDLWIVGEGGLILRGKLAF